MCPTTADGITAWTSVAAGASATGTCNAPLYMGVPTRTCQLNGVWGPVTSPCTLIPCPATTDAASSWTAATASYSSVTGSCNTGYATASGNPFRTCLNGAFTAIENPCNRTEQHEREQGTPG